MTGQSENKVVLLGYYGGDVIIKLIYYQRERSYEMV